MKNEFRNQMEDEWINNNLIVYVEKDVFNSIDNESITQYFQNMKSRREQLKMCYKKFYIFKFKFLYFVVI